MLERPCLIVIDMLNDFINGALKCERASRIIYPIKCLIEEAHRHNVPVIYCNDSHYPVDFEVTCRWGAHAIKGTEGAEIISELKPLDGDFIIEKRSYSCFYETGLDSLLRSLYGGEGVKTVILTGIHTHICVRHTAADAFFRGYRIIVPFDAVEAFTQEDHEKALREMEYLYGAKISPMELLLEEIRKLHDFRADSIRIS